MNTKQLFDLSSESSSDNVLTVKDMVNFFHRRKSILFISMGVLFTATLLWCIFGTKLYKAQGVIQIQKQDSDGFGLEGTLPGAVDADSDALDYNVTLETQARILQSDTLALEVVKELNLENTADFSGDKTFTLPHWMKPWAPVPEGAGLALEDAPIRRHAVLIQFNDRLKVESVSGTRLINISYSNPDPKLAAEVVNCLIRDFQDYTIQTRYTVTQQASAWLSGQINDLKSQTEELQSKAIKLQRETGLFGDNQDHNIILSKLEALNEGLVAAEGNRILKDAILHAVQTGDPEMVSNLAGNAPIGGALSQAPNSLSLVQTLRLQEASVKAQIAEDETKYGPNYPHMVELHGQLDSVDKALHAELGRVTGRARSDYEIAAESEREARASFETQKKVALQTNDKVIQFALAKQEADDSRDLYEDLLKKLKEAGVLEGMRSTNITVVDHGRSPAIPSRPYAPIFLPLSLGVGFVLGLFIALFADLTDNSIHGVEEMEQLTREPIMGVLPLFASPVLHSPRRGHASPLRLQIPGDTSPRMAIPGPSSYYVEAVRSLRTSLLFSRGTAPPQVIKISSPLEGEGKSTLVMTLGTVLAQQGARVLVVDADLRDPKLHSVAQVSSSSGLSTLLTTDSNSRTIQDIHGVPGLYLLPAGPVPPFPAEILGSPRMKALVKDWREKFDFVLFDSPPLLQVTDSTVLNQFTDFNLMLVRFCSTPKASFRCAYRALRQTVDPGTIGVVVNAFRRNSAEYQDYYGYKGNIHNLLIKGKLNERVN
jgi:capsular exopolysaccharide synthesis family protein